MTAALSHPEDLIADYVDGLLTAAEEHKIERHLIACQRCCAQVQQERELLARLREVHLDAGHHQQLMAGLLSLAGDEPMPRRQPTFADFREAPALMTTHAPAQYCSARRTVAFTLAAVAGCLGAALTVSQVPTTTAPTDGGSGAGVGTAAFSRTVQLPRAGGPSPEAPGPTASATFRSHTTRVSSISVSVPGR